MRVDAQVNRPARVLAQHRAETVSVGVRIGVDVVGQEISPNGILGERHLRAKLTEYAQHYNWHRLPQ
jgi:hypothetical protein